MLAEDGPVLMFIFHSKVHVCLQRLEKCFRASAALGADQGDARREAGEIVNDKCRAVGGGNGCKN